MSKDNQSFIFDALLQLHDGASAITDGGAGQVGGSAAILDMGGTNIHVEGKTVVDISAIALTTDELYTIHMQGSPDADFGTAANVRDLVKYDSGAGEALFNGTDGEDVGAVGERHVIPFINKLGDTLYRYLRLYVTTAGGGAEITFKANLVPE